MPIRIIFPIRAKIKAEMINALLALLQSSLRLHVSANNPLKSEQLLLVAYLAEHQ